MPILAPKFFHRVWIFEVSIPTNEIVVYGDRLFIAEAVKNLVDNAVKHAGSSFTLIKVTLSSNKNNTTLTVSDDGKGLSPEQQDEAFSWFSQIEPSDGSGLDLAIVSSVASPHNGKLEINPVSRGASISLTLPIHL